MIIARVSCAKSDIWLDGRIAETAAYRCAIEYIHDRLLKLRDEGKGLSFDFADLMR